MDNEMFVFIKQISFDFDLCFILHNLVFQTRFMLTTLAAVLVVRIDDDVKRRTENIANVPTLPGGAQSKSDRVAV